MSLYLASFIDNFISNSRVSTPISLFVAGFAAMAGVTGICTQQFALILVLIILILPFLTNIGLASLDASNHNFFPFDRVITGNAFNTPSRMSRYFRKGVSALHSGDFNEALDYLTIVDEYKMKDSWRAVLYYFFGRVYQHMGYPTNAANHFEKAIELDINCDDIYILAGRCYTNTGSFIKAMDMYNKLLTRNTDMEYVLTDMGVTCLKSGEPDKALEYFEKSIQKGKNYAFALGGCSLAHLQRKDMDKSLEYFGKAMANNLDDIDGFKCYYCRIAEGNGMIDQIDENMKKYRQENIFGELADG